MIAPSGSTSPCGRRSSRPPDKVRVTVPRSVSVYNRDVTRRTFLQLFPCAAGLALAGCGHVSSVREPTLVFGRSGEHEGEFHMPRGIGFSPDGKLMYLLDRSHRVQVFTRDGQYVKGWITPKGTNGNPRGLDVDPHGNIYVADTHNSEVIVYSPDGEMLRKWGRMGLRPGEFINVTDIALDSQGSVWTCEYGSFHDRLQKFTADGQFLFSVGTCGDRPGQFSRPQGVTVDRHDRLYVADAVNHRIQIFSPEGKLEQIWGSVGTARGKLRYPYDVAFDRHGRLYVAEFGNSRISVFTPEGRFVTSFGRTGHRPGEFDHPWGVNVAQNGEIYVADTMNYRIQRFAALPA